MKKDILYIVLVVLFAAGGVFAFAHSLGVSEDSLRNPVTPDASFAAIFVAPEPSPFESLRRETDSFVGIARSDVAEASDLTFEDVATLVREAVALAGGLENIVSDGDVVVLKPNLVSLRCNTLPGWQGRTLPPEANGNSTDYRVTRAVAQMVRELNPSGRIYVMEGSAVNPTADVFLAMNYTREHIPEVDAFFPIETDSGTWQDRNSPGLVRVRLENALLHEYYYFNRRLFEADVLISLPVLKNHWDTVTTGTIKNLGIGNTPTNIYGDGPNDNHRLRMVNHRTPDLHRWIVDYYTLRPADFTVMDALQGLEHGPTPSFDLSGVRNIADAQKNMRAVLASSDSLAIDIVQANIMNWDAESVMYLELLREAGQIGNGDTANITVLGVMVDEIRTDFAGPVPVTGGRRITNATPPTVEILSAYYCGRFIQLLINVSENTEKIDIYIDGHYATSFSGDIRVVEFNIEGLSADFENVTVYAFDRFMHHASASAELSDVTPDEPVYPGEPEIPPATVREYLILRVDNPVAIYRGEERPLDDMPFIRDGRVMVPFRFIGEALGATVTWDNVQSTAYFSRGDVFIAVAVGTPIYGDDGRYLGTPVIIDGRTFVPVRFISLRMGTQAVWNDRDRIVTVQLP